MEIKPVKMVALDIDVLEIAIERLGNRLGAAVTPDEALKFSQAALNLAHTIVMLKTAHPVDS